MSRARLGTITETFDDVLGSEPERLALITPSQTMSYAALDTACNAAAAAMANLGVTPGDRVACTLPNDADIVVAFHGAMRLGAIWVGVNRALAPAEKDELLTAAEPVVYIAEATVAAAHSSRWRTVTAGRADSPWTAAVLDSAGADRPPTPDQNLPAGIAFTSGTTGTPKGVVHSQHNLLLPAVSLASSRGYDETLRKGDCLPLTILNMQVLTTLVTSWAGGCCVLTDRRDANGVAEWIAKESVTVWNGVPAILYSMVHDSDFDPSLLASIRDLWSGGAPCPEELFDDVHLRLGLRLHTTYGLTEAPTVVSIEALHGSHAPDASGSVLPHIEVAICDDTGAELGTGESGEIVLRTPHHGTWAGQYRPMLGYWVSGQVDPFGADELRTGDIGSFDSDGNLFIHDRKKLVIIRGGANVYPAEVERVIDRMAGVRSSTVIGLPDERLGQVVAAVIESEPGNTVTPAEVMAHCRELLARYKVPERVITVVSLPRNAMGKVQRQPLAALFAEEKEAQQ